MSVCPSGFLGGSCTLTGGDELALSVNFNIPNDTFTNSGSSSGTLASLTTTIDSGSGAGHPAKYRGLYFDGANNGYIELPDFRLNHSFSVHSWVLVKVLGDLTVYSRDRDDFSNGTSHQHLRLSIGGTSNNKLVA